MNNSHECIKSGAAMAGAGTGLAVYNKAVGNAVATASSGAIAAGTATTAAGTVGAIMATGGVALVAIGVVGLAGWLISD
jgi:hypothetical protein